MRVETAMEVGDLVRIKPSKNDCESMEGYLLHVTEVAKTGISVVVLSDCVHFGDPFFLPTGNREIEIISLKKIKKIEQN